VHPARVEHYDCEIRAPGTRPHDARRRSVSVGLPYRPVLRRLEQHPRGCEIDASIPGCRVAPIDDSAQSAVVSDDVARMKIAVQPARLGFYGRRETRLPCRHERRLRIELERRIAPETSDTFAKPFVARSERLPSVRIRRRQRRQVYAVERTQESSPSRSLLASQRALRRRNAGDPRDDAPRPRIAAAGDADTDRSRRRDGQRRGEAREPALLDENALGAELAARQTHREPRPE